MNDDDDFFDDDAELAVELEVEEETADDLEEELEWDREGELEEELAELAEEHDEIRDAADDLDDFYIVGELAPGTEPDGSSRRHRGGCLWMLVILLGPPLGLALCRLAGNWA